MRLLFLFACAATLDDTSVTPAGAAVSTPTLHTVAVACDDAGEAALPVPDEIPAMVQILEVGEGQTGPVIRDVTAELGNLTIGEPIRMTCQAPSGRYQMTWLSM